MAKTYSVTIAGKDYEVSYGLKVRRQVEEIVKPLGLFEAMHTPRVEAQAAVIWGALQRGLRKGEELTVDDVVEMLDAHIEDGGDIKPILKTVRRAVFVSGVIGTVSQKLLDRVAPEDKEEAEAAIVPR